MSEFSLEKYLPREITHKNLNLSPDYDTKALTSGLSQPVWDMLDRGGKHWRGALCLISGSLFSSSITPLIPLSHALELIHSGSLVCDDIEDSSQNRRGKPCTYKIFGIDTALNTGNFMYFLPLKIVMDSNLPDQAKMLLYSDYTEEMINIHYGQCTDIQWNKTEFVPSQGQYFRMVSCKTSVLARLAVKFGIRPYNPSPEISQALIQHAENIGISFQIWDDIINLESEEYAKGRSYLGEDITEGKKTLIIIRAVEQLKNPQRLLHILSLKTNNLSLVNEALHIISTTDAMSYCKTLASELIESSWKILGQKLPESEAKEDLFYLSFKLINRKS
jgi:geranylgeranyl pyrophosphate synthase